MPSQQRREDRHLLESLHSAALYEVAIVLLYTPVDVRMQDTRLIHPKEVLLTVKSIKQVVLPCCYVPLSLQNAAVPFKASAAHI